MSRYDVMIGTAALGGFMGWVAYTTRLPFLQGIGVVAASINFAMFVFNAIKIASGEK